MSPRATPLELLDVAQRLLDASAHVIGWHRIPRIERAELETLDDARQSSRHEGVASARRLLRCHSEPRCQFTIRTTSDRTGRQPRTDASPHHVLHPLGNEEEMRGQATNGVGGRDRRRVPTIADHRVAYERDGPVQRLDELGTRGPHVVNGGAPSSSA